MGPIWRPKRNKHQRTINPIIDQFHDASLNLYFCEKTEAENWMDTVAEVFRSKSLTPLAKCPRDGGIARCWYCHPRWLCAECRADFSLFYTVYFSVQHRAGLSKASLLTKQLVWHSLINAILFNRFAHSAGPGHEYVSSLPGGPGCGLAMPKNLQNPGPEALKSRSGGVLGRLVGVLGRPGALVGCLGSVLGASWAILKAS